MEWKKIVKKLLFLPVWAVAVLTVISAAALIDVFTKGTGTSVKAIITYVVSFYTLVVLCVGIFTSFPVFYKNTKNKLYENKFANRYITDKRFNTNIRLYRSILVNLIYVVFNAVSAVVFDTNWFGIFALYYAVLACMRLLLAVYTTRNQLGTNRLAELKRSRLCACILVTVNMAISAAVLMMIYFDRGFEYKGFFIYVMAMYTFYATISAITDIIRYRRYNSPVMSASNIIKLSASLVSMLFLETAMFSQFGAEMSRMAQNTMIIATGAGIGLVIIGLSSYMIVSATKEIKSIMGENI